MADEDGLATLVRPRLSARLTGIQTFRSLRHTNYRYFWFGILAAAAGSWMEQVALGWLVWKLTESTFMVGAAYGLRSFPYLLISPLGGVIADRFDRRRSLLMTQCGPLCFAGIMAVLILSGVIQVWQAMTVAFLSGIVQAVHNPVRQALVPNLVEREDVMNALALQSTGFQIMATLGPAVAGGLIVFTDIGGVYALLAVLYLLALLLTYRIKLLPRTRPATVPSVLQSLREGFTYIARQPLIASLLVLAIFPIMFGWSVTTLLPTFADRLLNVGPSGYGLLQTSLGIGAVVATITIASLHGHWIKGKIIVGMVAIMGTGIVLFAFAPALPPAMAFLAIAGAARMSFMTMVNTTIQLTVPDELRGRVMSVVMLDWGLTTLGGFIAGSLADLFSARIAAAFLGSVCMSAAAVFWLWVRPVRRLH